jgi:hypothetical protein
MRQDIKGYNDRLENYKSPKSLHVSLGFPNSLLQSEAGSGFYTKRAYFRFRPFRIDTDKKHCSIRNFIFGRFCLSADSD